MSIRRNNSQSRPANVDRQQQSQILTNHSNTNSVTQPDILPNMLPELNKAIRRSLPRELPFNMFVPNIEYQENGHEHVIGTLYMTTFRLVFAPDKQLNDDNFIFSGNKYIGEFDIPLTSIYKINITSSDSRSGFTSFFDESQTESEIRAFTIITRDFRHIKFTKCSIVKYHSNGIQQSQISSTKMDTYIDILKIHCRFKNQLNLYPYLALNNSSSKTIRSNTISTMENHQWMDDQIADFCLSNDQRIKSYMTFNDWRDELYEANEQQWIVNRKKFDEQDIVQSEGPYVRLLKSNDNDNSEDLVWHWTHTSQIEIDHYNRKQMQIQKFMLITVPGIGEINNVIDPMKFSMSILNTQSSATSLFRFDKLKKKISKPLRSNDSNGPMLICTNENDSTTTSDLSNLSMQTDVGLRRVITDTNLTSSFHNLYQQSFQRYNLAKFPCNLKRLQTSFEKLIEICVVTPQDDDEKWLTKLNTCKWLKYISIALHGAASLAKSLNFRHIELVGSDYDNNCLMSSLIQILLRPKCRTIKGFCELIVREWIIRGHKFRERFGLVVTDGNGYPSQESPVFLLFLDCVHQLIVQNPSSFEFTEHLLIELYRNICYCYHHTFVFNNVLERLKAIQNCPRNLLLLSSFDFSLYLDADVCHLLKNNASIFNFQDVSSSHQQIKPQIETTIMYSCSTLSQQQTNPTVYYLETPKSTNFTIDISSTNESIALNVDQYEYERIKSPQIFQDDFHVDWRTFNLVLWTKCYCRYDKNQLPTSNEQELSIEINSLKDNIKNFYLKSKKQITIDTFQSIGHANSWHPKALDTRV